MKYGVLSVVSNAQHWGSNSACHPACHGLLRCNGCCCLHHNYTLHQKPFPKLKSFVLPPSLAAEARLFSSSSNQFVLIVSRKALLYTDWGGGGGGGVSLSEAGRGGGRGQQNVWAHYNDYYYILSLSLSFYGWLLKWASERTNERRFPPDGVIS